MPSGRHDRDAETNVLVGGFTNEVMTRVMKGVMKVVAPSSLRPTNVPPGASETTSPQVRSHDDDHETAVGFHHPGRWKSRPGHLDRRHRRWEVSWCRP